MHTEYFRTKVSGSTWYVRFEIAFRTIKIRDGCGKRRSFIEGVYLNVLEYFEHIERVNEERIVKRMK